MSQRARLRSAETRSAAGDAATVRVVIVDPVSGAVTDAHSGARWSSVAAMPEPRPGELRLVIRQRSEP